MSFWNRKYKKGSEVYYIDEIEKIVYKGKIADKKDSLVKVYFDTAITEVKTYNLKDEIHRTMYTSELATKADVDEHILAWNVKNNWHNMGNAVLF